MSIQPNCANPLNLLPEIGLLVLSQPDFPWDRIEKIEEIQNFIYPHLLEITRHSTDTDLITVLENLISRITRTFNNQRAKEIALFIRGISIGLDDPPSTPLWNQCPPNILTKIFFEAIVSDQTFYNLQLVCKRWQTLSSRAWKQKKEATMLSVNPNRINQWIAHNPECKKLNLTHLPLSLQTKIPASYPNLTHLVINESACQTPSLSSYCPQLEFLRITKLGDHFLTLMLLPHNFSGFSKLRHLILEPRGLTFSQLALPTSIETVVLKHFIPFSIDLDPTAAIKSLKILGKCIQGIIATALDLTTDGWSKLEHLEVIGCIYQNIRLANKMKQLRHIHIEHCNNLEQLSLDLSRSQNIAYINITSENLSLSVPNHMPHLTMLKACSSYQGKIGALSLSASNKLHTLHLENIRVGVLSLPESIETLILSRCHIDYWNLHHSFPHLKTLILDEVYQVPEELLSRASSHLDPAAGMKRERQEDWEHIYLKEIKKTKKIP